MDSSVYLSPWLSSEDSSEDICGSLSLFSVMEPISLAGPSFVSIPFWCVQGGLDSDLLSLNISAGSSLPHLCTLPPHLCCFLPPICVASLPRALPFGICLSQSLLLLFLLSPSMGTMRETQVENHALRPLLSHCIAQPKLSELGLDSCGPCLTQRLKLWVLRHCASPSLPGSPRGSSPAAKGAVV